MEGWNHIPHGYGAIFNFESGPAWLRIWIQIPFVDRFAYPIAVRKGLGTLIPMPNFLDKDRENIGPGWNVGYWNVG